jgi:hypothetical protein
LRDREDSKLAEKGQARVSRSSPRRFVGLLHFECGGDGSRDGVEVANLALGFSGYRIDKGERIDLSKKSIEKRQDASV